MLGSPVDVTGRVVLVTGGYGGLGAAMASSLHNAGAKVAIVGREFRGKPPDGILPLSGDVTSWRDMEEVVAEVVSHFGTLTCLVNNAGAYCDNKLMDPDFLRAWNALIGANLTGAAICSAVAAPFFVERGYGKIINLGSAYSQFGHHKSVGYTAAKTGIVGLTKGLAAELGRSGVRVNAVLPGWFDTQMNDGVPGSPRGEFIEDVTPLGRWGKASDMEGIVVFLCSAASDFITGTAVPIDGGYSISDRSYAHV